MQYRRFGRVGWQVSALGFGCMRLPTKGTYEVIDEELAIAMLRYAVDNGVNYIDTAYGYHGGNSEKVVGRALEGGYREKVYLATKLPHWHVQNLDDCSRILNEQLERLRTDHLDVYLLHSLSKGAWEKLRQMNIFRWAEDAMAKGLFRVLGFSFHDTYEVFQEIVDAYDNWGMCQIQYNILNENVQAGTKGLQYAASKGLAVVIMEPLLGGRLANPPSAVRQLLEAAPVKRSPAEWALQWLWNKPEVSVVLSGMSTMEQVQENIRSASRSGVGTMSLEELELISKVQRLYEQLHPIPCTGCEYCMPCPNGVNIPRIFAIYNEGVVYEEMDRARERYNRLPEGERASECIACRVCETKCPQHIEISEWMARLAEELAPSR